ncbi:MAG: hypothetical protein ACRD0V_18950 [Acidimicrobiales bacterium]
MAAASHAAGIGVATDVDRVPSGQGHHGPGGAQPVGHEFHGLDAAPGEDDGAAAARHEPLGDGRTDVGRPAEHQQRLNGAHRVLHVGRG